MSKQALGRGFDGLIPTGFNLADVASPGEQVKQIDILKIVANPDQPRKQFDESSLKDLAQSIKEHGIIQPIVVTPHKDSYRIVAGERRFRASQIAKLKKIPAIVRDHEELEELEIAIVENVQRVDLSPLEQAVSIVRLRDQFSLSPKEISKKLGKAETTISNIIRLLQLPKEAVEALQKNVISEGHARAILSLKTDVKAQSELLSKIVVQKLSVREAEALSKQLKNGSKKTKKYNSPETLKLLKGLNKSLASSININEKSNNSGRIVIDYKNQNELEQFLKRLNQN